MMSTLPPRPGRPSAEETLPVEARVSRFAGHAGADEYQLMLRPTVAADVPTQLRWLEEAYAGACAAHRLPPGSAVFRRLFCSDLAGQADALAASALGDSGAGADACAISRVEQPPMAPAQVALWASHLCPPEGALEKARDGGWLAVRRGPLTHLWTTGLTCPWEEDSRAQSEGIFIIYDAGLRARGLTLAGHVLRTWLFVRDIDADYQGLVEARRDFFAGHGLTPATHYIASTGIAGAVADPRALVMLDAYAIAGVQPAQIRYLAAPDHLCPTYRYGVTFERGVSIAYRDRRQLLISGTASIDASGSIVHPGDVEQQCARTLENIRALLADGGAAPHDVQCYLVYLRHPGDLAIADRLLQQAAGDAPRLVLLAPVCRPGWLIEIECMATVPDDNPGLPEY